MIFKSLQYNLPIKDSDFDKIYPEYIQDLSDAHWTSVDIARKAAKFLVTDSQTKVLDIGSGVGKFCFIGATTTPGYFYGIEQRKKLVEISKKIIKDHSIDNVKIIHANITDINFSHYNSFYFFNSFYENIDQKSIIDLHVKVSSLRYKQYRDYMYLQLLKAPIGTRIVTYSGFDTQIPPCYKVKMTDYNNSLKFWIKETVSIFS